MLTSDTISQVQTFILPFTPTENNSIEAQEEQRSKCGFCYNDVLQLMLTFPESLNDCSSVYDILTSSYCEDVLEGVPEDKITDTLTDIGMTAMELIEEISETYYNPIAHIHSFKERCITDMVAVERVDDDGLAVTMTFDSEMENEIQSEFQLQYQTNQ